MAGACAEFHFDRLAGGLMPKDQLLHKSGRRLQMGFSSQCFQLGATGRSCEGSQLRAAGLESMGGFVESFRVAVFHGLTNPPNKDSRVF